MLLVDDTRIHPEINARSCQWCAFNIYLGSLQVHGILQVEFHFVRNAVGHLALVGDVDGEACRLAVGYIRDAWLVGPDAQFVNLLRRLVKDNSRIIEHGPAFLLPRACRGTGQRTEYKVAVARRIAQSVQIGQGIHRIGLSAVYL